MNNIISTDANDRKSLRQRISLGQPTLSKCHHGCSDGEFALITFKS